MIVQAPRQRNTREENALIKDGEVPPDWIDEPAKLAQKDLDARWTQKRGQTYYGYKQHVNVDEHFKFIRATTVTDASIHDSQVLGAVLDFAATERAIYADSAYRSREWEEWIAAAGMTSMIAERPYAKRELSAQQIAANRMKAAVRARVEHVFGYMHTSMNRIFVRTIGLARARMHLELTSLTYNMARLGQLQRARCWRTTA